MQTCTQYTVNDTTLHSWPAVTVYKTSIYLPKTKKNKKKLKQTNTSVTDIDISSLPVVTVNHNGHITGDIRDNLPSQSLDWCKTLSLLNQSLADSQLTTSQLTHKTADMCTNKENEAWNLGSEAFYTTWPWNRLGLIYCCQCSTTLMTNITGEQSKDITDTRVYDTFRQGLSVCAPMMENPPPGLYCPPTANAIRVDWLRVTKYWTHCHRTRLVVFFIHHYSVD